MFSISAGAQSGTTRKASRSDAPSGRAGPAVGDGWSRMARLAGRIADGALVNGIVTDSWLRERKQPALTDGAGDHSPEGGVDVGLMLRVCLHDGSPAGRRQALDRLRRSLTLYAQVPYFHELAAAAGVDAQRMDDLDLELLAAAT